MKNLFQKINDIQRKVKSVYKGSTVKINDRSSYSAVSHDDVTSLLHDPLAEAGIVAMPRMESCDLEIFDTSKTFEGKTTVTKNYLVKVWASVTFFNSDDRADSFQTQCYAYAIDSGDKATGKAYSMAIKYCYLKTFMLESLDEEESRDWENYNQSFGYSNITQRVLTNPVQRSESTQQKAASPAQIKLIQDIANKKNIPVPEIKSSIEASKWINDNK